MRTELTLSAAYGAFVCDLDGVVYRGAAGVEHAVEALVAAGRPIQFATNNASRAPADVAAHLCELGLDVAPGDVATSSQAGAAALRARLGAGSPVLAVGGPGVALALAEAGLRAVRPGDTAQVAGVLQGYGPQVTAAMLGEAAYAVAGGAWWVATNLDPTLPTERGTAPGNGTLVAAVRTATGRDPDEVVGKPYPALYVLCARRLGLPPERVLGIGDRLDTDIEGAVAAGIDSLLVLTGVSTLTEAVVAPPVRRPTYLAVDLRALAEPLPRAARAGPDWVCGEDRGRVVDSRWVSAGTGTPAQALTNRLHAVYEAQDANRLDHASATVIVAGSHPGD